MRMASVLNHICITLIAAIWLSSFAYQAAADEPVLAIRGKAVIETVDGQILAGRIGDVTGNRFEFDMEFGELELDFKSLLRVNGDDFDPEHGLIRRHEAMLRKDGSVKLDYLAPASIQRYDERISLLAPGRVIQILDLDRRPLGFASTSTGDFSRCVISAPDYRLPALRVQTLIAGAALIENGMMKYVYRYTPRETQRFEFTLGLPAGASVAAVTPEATRDDDSTLKWILDLGRQQTTIFEVNLTF